jgi:hypothetical protein
MIGSLDSVFRRIRCLVFSEIGIITSGVDHAVGRDVLDLQGIAPHSERIMEVPWISRPDPLLVDPIDRDRLFHDISDVVVVDPQGSVYEILFTRHRLGE